MLLLALDTCDSRGSLALAEGETLLGVVSRPSNAEYSSWLIPAASDLLRSAGKTFKDLSAVGAAAGPGSFTGVRIGLTTAKAWSEVFGLPLVPVSRLEVLALQANANSPYVAACVDAQRDQVFAALYRNEGTSISLVGEEAVLSLDAFLQSLQHAAPAGSVSWITLDPQVLNSNPAWLLRKDAGESMQAVEPILAPSIAALAIKKLAAGLTKDALTLDANYVRRSDAELFWKKASSV